MKETAKDSLDKPNILCTSYGSGISSKTDTQYKRLL